MPRIWTIIFLSDCTESSLLMFKDGIEEFYKSLMEKINHLLASSAKDMNVSRQKVYRY